VVAVFACLSITLREEERLLVWVAPHFSLGRRMLRRIEWADESEVGMSYLEDLALRLEDASSPKFFIFAEYVH
jgi:hypothetical protein